MMFTYYHIIDKKLESNSVDNFKEKCLGGNLVFLATLNLYMLLT